MVLKPGIFFLAKTKVGSCSKHNALINLERINPVAPVFNYI